MEIRKAKLADLSQIMEIYAKARIFMAEHGNAEQWAGGYPQEELIRKHIQDKEFYVCMEEKEIACVFQFFIGEDADYQKIENGAWLNDAPYAVVHKVASARGIKGAATFCINWCYEQWQNLRMDTHENNIPMQNFLKKAGFRYCGIVYTGEHSKRLAFQKCPQ